MGPAHRLADAIADTLVAEGLAVECRPIGASTDLTRFDAVVAGGDLRSGRWSHAFQRFVASHAEQLRQRPLWLFSCGDAAPLDEAASMEAAALAQLAGSRAHVMFGNDHGGPWRIAGGLTGDHGLDWHGLARVRLFADAIAQAVEPPLVAPPERPKALPIAKPARGLGHGFASLLLTALSCSGG